MLDKRYFLIFPFHNSSAKGKSLPVPSGNHVILLSFLLFTQDHLKFMNLFLNLNHILRKQAASPPQSPVEAEKIPFGSDKSSADY